MFVPTEGTVLSLLFTFTMETLFMAVQQTPEVVGIFLGPLEQKISFYADEAFVYLNG